MLEEEDFFDDVYVFKSSPWVIWPLENSGVLIRNFSHYKRRWGGGGGGRTELFDLSAHTEDNRSTWQQISLANQSEVWLVLNVFIQSSQWESVFVLMTKLRTLSSRFPTHVITRLCMCLGPHHCSFPSSLLWPESEASADYVYSRSGWRPVHSLSSL